MKVRDELIEKIKGNNGLKKELEKVLGVSRTTVWNLLTRNDDNGDLTKAVALKVIGEHYNLEADDVLDEVKTA